MSLIEIDRRLSEALRQLSFSEPVTHVYDPLDYAREPHEIYLSRFGQGPKEVVFLGMNPGPFGMAQTGVPFGEIAAVRDWMGIEAPVSKPAFEHPNRPIEGFACTRSEVSGRRLWGWAQEQYGTASRFFHRFFVLNYCPLVFMEASGKNRTPDKLPTQERQALFKICDRALVESIAVLQPKLVVGIGAFAETRGKKALESTDSPPTFGRILHPSPASPKANKGWAQCAQAELEALGIRAP